MESISNLMNQRNRQYLFQSISLISILIKLKLQMLAILSGNANLQLCAN